MASLGGLEIEYEMSLTVDHLKNFLLGLTQVAFSACQETEIYLAVPGDDLKHHFRHFVLLKIDARQWVLIFCLLNSPKCDLGKLEKEMF